MLLLLLLLATAYIQDGIGKKQPAYFWAIVFAVACLIFLMVLGDEFVNATFMALIMGVYAWAYFKVLRIFGNSSIIWIIICLVGAILPILLSLMML